MKYFNFFDFFDFLVSVDHLDSFEGVFVVAEFEGEGVVLGLHFQNLVFHLIVIFHDLLLPSFGFLVL